MDYYYIVASLPHIELGSAPPLGGDDFLRQCQGVLGEDKLAEIEAVLDGRIEECGSGYGCELVSAETQLRNAIARIRAQKEGVDPRGFMREHADFKGWIEKLATNAFTRDNPRERIMALDHARWRIADELAGIEHFSFGSVLAFAVKLRIAIRWHELDKQRGSERIEEFIDKETESGDNNISMIDSE